MTSPTPTDPAETSGEPAAAPPAPADPTVRRRSLPAQSQRPFQLMLVVGSADPAQEIADSVASITPADVDGAPRAFAAAGLAPSDLRSRTMFLVDGSVPTLAAMASYGVAVGFSSRFLDVATPDGVVVSNHHRAGRELPDRGKAPLRPDLVVVVGPSGQVPPDLPTLVLGDEAADADVRVVSFGDSGLDHLGPDEVSALRSARRAVLCPSAGSYDAFRELLVLSGARARKNFERLPVVVRDGAHVDLDEMRRRGAELRKEHRGYQASLAPRTTPNARQLRLCEAAAVPMEEVLAELGSVSGGDMWQCPRPWSHTHGDATPSMQVSAENKVRCHVDDSEWIDPLRLVAEVCNITADEAADVLLDRREDLAAHRQRILEERARRSA